MTIAVLCYLRPLPAWVCMSIRLPMFTIVSTAFCSYLALTFCNAQSICFAYDWVLELLLHFVILYNESYTKSRWGTVAVRDALRRRTPCWRRRAQWRASRTPDTSPDVAFVAFHTHTRQHSTDSRLHLRVGPARPPTRAVIWWSRSNTMTSLTLSHLPHYVKRWRHPLWRKYITHCIIATATEDFVTCDFWDMLANRHTNTQTHRHANRNT